MSSFDLIIRNADIATASERMQCDIGIKNALITALAKGLPGDALEEFDAGGALVTPGGVDSHCHIEQASSDGVMTADDFYSGTVSAAHGGTTTVIPFAAQMRGESLREVVAAYHKCAGPKAVIDYAFHLIITDPTQEAVGQELPALVEDGVTSFKVYMTYDGMKLDDYQMLTVLQAARELGAMTMIHAENHDVIKWLTDKLLDSGRRAPKYHAISHARIAEGEATNRAIQLARLIDAPMLVVHVSEIEATAAIRNAQTQGLKIYGETCPQYVFLTQQDLDKQGMDGAMFCCSPPPRDTEAQEAIWRGLANGTFQVYSSDHAPYRFDETGKLKHGPNTHFKKIANGVPGIELRLPMLLSEGVGKGRIDIHQFVALTATNAAKLYGLFPRKGTIAIGADADFVIWDTEKEVTITYDLLHDNVGYTPYEGKRIKGWPKRVYSRGRAVVADGALTVERGSGQFLECEKPESAKPTGVLQKEIDPAQAWGFGLS